MTASFSSVSRLAGLAILFSLAPIAGAAAPAWESQLTDAPLGPHRDVPPCEIVFDIGWNRIISAGRISVSVDRSGRFWRAHASGGSTGLARKLWRYDLEMNSSVDQATLHSRHTTLSETDSEETCRYDVAFEPHRVVTETTIDPHQGPSHTAVNALPYGPVDDLLGVILYVRSLDLRPGQQITRIVQPWDRPYVAKFDVQGRQTLNFGGKKTPCIKIGVQVQKIDRNTLEMKSYGKVKKATIWLSDDELRMPIEMRAEIWIGYISASMVSLKTQRSSND